MYAKIFGQIFDSSIAENYRVRHIFMDLLTLARSDGVIDMTPDAIARRTNVPLEEITHAIAELEKEDPQSRSKSHKGARLVKLDKHRSWGWRIVNYATYRKVASELERRLVDRVRKRNQRISASPPNAVVQDNSGQDRTKVENRPSPSPSVQGIGVGGKGNGELTAAERISLDRSITRGEERLRHLEGGRPYPKGDPSVAEMKNLRLELKKMKARIGVPI